MALKVTKKLVTALEEGREAYFSERSSSRDHKELRAAEYRELSTGTGPPGCGWLRTLSLGKVSAENTPGREAVKVSPRQTKSYDLHRKGGGAPWTAVSARAL